MANGALKVKQNYLAILIAAIACFLIEAAWYSFFLQDWLQGIGRTREWLMASGVNPALQYATALVSEAVIAAVISRITQMTGAQTIWRGMNIAAFMWIGFVLPTWTTEYVFEVRTYKLYAINTCFWLIGMIVMGAIVGGWKAKKPVQGSEVRDQKEGVN